SHVWIVGSAVCDLLGAAHSDDQCFALPGGHDLFPRLLRAPSWPVDVRELPDVVDLYRLSPLLAMDSQDGIGVTHHTYLYDLLSDPSVSLRLGVLPCGRLSRPRTITETPFPWGLRPVGNPAFRAPLTNRVV